MTLAFIARARPSLRRHDNGVDVFLRQPRRRLLRVGRPSQQGMGSVEHHDVGVPQTDVGSKTSITSPPFEEARQAHETARVCGINVFLTCCRTSRPVSHVANEIPAQKAIGPSTPRLLGRCLRVFRPASRARSMQLTLAQTERWTQGVEGINAGQNPDAQTCHQMTRASCAVVSGTDPGRTFDTVEVPWSPAWSS